MVVVGPLLVPPADAPAGRTTPYTRALQDTAFRALVGRRYAGGHDVLDALWWLEHPHEPGPTGARPPEAVLADARRRLYTASPPADAVASYAAVAERERADRASLVRALGEDERPVVPPLTEPVVPAPHERVVVAGRSVRRARHRLAVVALAVLAALAVLGWARSPGRPASSARQVVLVEARVGAQEALEPFAPSGGRAVTERRLVGVAGATIDAVRTPGLLCLELRSRHGTSGTCRSVAAFQADGLEIAFPTGTRTISEARWTPDGRLLITVAR